MSDLRAFQQMLVTSINAASGEPLEIYRNTIALGAIEALRANYPVVRQLVGEEMFDAMATDFNICCPPQTPILALYGARLSEWIADQPWVQSIPYLPDIARIERLFIRSLFAADREPATIENFADIFDWNNLRLQVHPACHFDWFTSPAAQIWLAHRGLLRLQDIEWRAEGFLFSRPRQTIQSMVLDRPLHRFMFGLRLGETVGASALATAKLYPDADIGKIFTELVSAGAFAVPKSRRK